MGKLNSVQDGITMPHSPHEHGIAWCEYATRLYRRSSAGGLCW